MQFIKNNNPILCFSLTFCRKFCLKPLSKSKFIVIILSKFVMLNAYKGRQCRTLINRPKLVTLFPVHKNYLSYEDIVFIFKETST